MANTIQIKRGTTAAVSAYTGAAGELTMDTTLNQVSVHDGTTAGGHKMQTVANLVTSVSSASTDDQYPSAKLLYDTLGDIETLLAAI